MSSSNNEKRDLRLEELQVLQMKLLDSIKARREQLEELHSESSRFYEDAVYRFYHQSFKVLHLQEITSRMVQALRDLLPDQKLNTWFTQIVEKGTGRVFELECNQHWMDCTRPIIEAFVHAQFMLEMAIRHSELPEPPQMMPSGWAALLYLYNLR